MLSPFDIAFFFLIKTNCTALLKYCLISVTCFQTNAHFWKMAWKWLHFKAPPIITNNITIKIDRAVSHLFMQFVQLITHFIIVLSRQKFTFALLGPLKNQIKAFWNIKKQVPVYATGYTFMTMQTPFFKWIQSNLKKRGIFFNVKVFNEQI